VSLLLIIIIFFFYLTVVIKSTELEVEKIARGSLQILERQQKCNHFGKGVIETNRSSGWPSNHALTKSSLYIVGTLRMGFQEDPHGRGVLPNLQMIASYWPHSYTMILYGDNVSIAEFKSYHDPCIYFIREADKKHEHRTYRLMHGRNLLMQAVQNFVKVKGEDPDNTYIAVLDLDGVNASPFSRQVFEYVMQHSNEWDAVSFNRRHFYDIWALRYDRYDFNAPYHKIGDASIIQQIEKEIVIDIKNSGRAFFPVNSSFNGKAIYKYKYTVGCKYIGWDAGEQEGSGILDCEHVAFHRCMKSKHGARVVIHSMSLEGDLGFLT